jgi:hypothetical protein
MKSKKTAIGFRIKRGVAIAVAVTGETEYPVFAGRTELLLSDPRIASTLRPFHAMARLPLKEAIPLAKRDEGLVRAAAIRSMSTFIAQLEKANSHPRHAAIVSDREPASISNSHLKAHSDERRLFRDATATAARRHGVRCTFLVEDELAREAKKRLGLDRTAIDRWVMLIRDAAGRPWRADERAAAVAAWIALHSN